MNLPEFLVDQPDGEIRLTGHLRRKLEEMRGAEAP
jgi:hypothetical protein